MIKYWETGLGQTAIASIAPNSLRLSDAQPFEVNKLALGPFSTLRIIVFWPVVKNAIQASLT